jgi:uncharacterized OsmC-like protein
MSFNVHVDSVVRMREDNRDFQACRLSSIVKGQADDQARKRWINVINEVNIDYLLFKNASLKINVNISMRDRG